MATLTEAANPEKTKLAKHVVEASTSVIVESDVAIGTSDILDKLTVAAIIAPIDFPNRVSPAVGDVRSAIQYGLNGTELTGTLVDGGGSGGSGSKSRASGSLGIKGGFK